MKLSYTISIFLLLLNISAIGQDWKTDTLAWGGQLFITDVPSQVNRSIDDYTEGVFINYTFSDTSTFCIFHGFNSRVTLYKQAEFDTLVIDFNTLSGTIGKSGKLWKAVKISDNLIYWYNFVAPYQKETFERMMGSFRFEAMGHNK